MDPVVIPGSLEGLSDEELSALEAGAVTEFSALNDSDATDDTTLGRMEALSTGIGAVRTEQAARVAAATTSADRKAALAAQVAPAPAPVAPVVAPVEAAVVPVAPAVEVPAAVVASATPPLQVVVPEATKPLLTITAAADIPQIAHGSKLDLDGLAKAIHNKARTLANHSGNVPIATFDKAYPEGYNLDGLSEAQQFDRIIELSAANSMSQSLTASGGWCAPSEILYSFFDLECARGSVLNLPTFKANRGGVRWPISTPLPPVDTTDWIWTEADDIAVSGTKPCITVPCPDFDECRLDAHGICVTAGNLMSRAYPENLRRYINQVFIAHERNENLRKIAVISGLSIPVTLDGSFGAASALLSAILLQAANYRDKYRMCNGATLEAIFPLWVRDLVRADIARQDGTLNIGTFPSDAQVDAWFRSVGISPQFVNDWQALTDDAITAWPLTVSFLLYAPGTFVQFDGGTLDLGVVRDSTLNATNDYTAVWTEEFYCIGLRGYESRLVTVPVCPLGEVGGRNPSTGEATCPTA